MDTPHNTIYKTKQLFFLLFLVLLFIPFLQLLFHLVPERPLDGIDPAEALPVFSVQSWLNGDYQKDYDDCYEKKIGFHNSLVRLHNQINYSVFNTSDAGDVVVGKNNYIFLKPYVYAYTGADFLGSEYIDIQSQKIKVIQDELKKRNIDFFIAFAPGKGSFYSEYIPDDYKKNMCPDSTNYVCYKKKFADYNVNLLDLRSIFLYKKKSEKYSLYMTTGVHWTQYGSYLAGTEMVKYIERLRKIKLPEIKLQSIQTLSFSGKEGTDYDAAALMNIFATVPHADVVLPELVFKTDPRTVRPYFLCISDSYFHGIIHSHIPENVFTDYHEWHYYDRVFPESFLKEKTVDKKRLKEEIEKQNIVCLLVTDATLPAFPFGFVDDVYEIYAQKDTAYYQLKKIEFKQFIAGVYESINKNKTWKDQLIKTAKERKISEAQEFFENAYWLYNQKYSNK